MNAMILLAQGAMNMADSPRADGGKRSGNEHA